MSVKETKEKAVPLRCVCGSSAAVVYFKSKKMVSCPNPEMCRLGPKTIWHKTEQDAIKDWNGIIIANSARRSNK